MSAYVSLSVQATRGNSYDLESDHSVIAYFQYPESSGTFYEDPYDFSTSFASTGGDGSEGGSSDYTPNYSTVVYVQTECIYLGSTTGVASTVSVTPWITSVSPAQFNPGTQNTVTITGGGFGASPTLGFSPGAGLSYTILSASDNTITLALNVAASASPGTSNVTVISNGVSGQGFLSGSGVSPQSNAVSININGATCTYVIAQDKQKFSIGGDYLTASIPLEVTESTHNAACAGKVTWSVQFNYHPPRGYPSSKSGTLFPGCGTVNKTLTFQTPTGVGGQGTVRATIQAGNQVVTPPAATIYVDGTSIPTSLITNQLYSLYSGGATPGLMTGIAMTESTYYHFTQPTAYCYNPPSQTYSYTGNKLLFGLAGSWPNAACSDGGSHVGLMMVPTTMTDAYNWQTNAQDGVNLFVHDKLGTAGRYEAKFYSCYPNLPQLTLAQSELDALVFYGPASYTVGAFSCSYAPGAGAYWIPNANETGWVVNSNNAGAISYVKTVNKNIQQ